MVNTIRKQSDRKDNETTRKLGIQTAKDRIM